MQGVYNGVIERPTNYHDETHPTGAQVKAQIVYLDSANEYRDYLPRPAQRLCNVTECNPRDRADGITCFWTFVFIVAVMAALAQLLEDLLR